MTRRSIRAMASLLRRAWLLAGVLAVIAGLLGMHVLTAGHASHGSGSHSSLAHSAVAHSAVAGSGPAPGAPALHDAVGHSAGADHAGGPAMAAAAICGSPCPLAREPGAQCIPSAPSAPQTGHPPQATRAVLRLLHPVSSPRPAYGYLPPSPTPCDLSISRT